MNGYISELVASRSIYSLDKGRPVSRDEEDDEEARKEREEDEEMKEKKRKRSRGGFRSGDIGGTIYKLLVRSSASPSMVGHT